jgi:hypothetical protein
MDDAPDSTSLDPPINATAGDRGVAIVKGLLGAVPFAGASLQELFVRIVKAPLDRRRESWMQSVADRLLRLEKENRTELAALADNDTFISIVVRATEAAVHTHDATKLDALRNAIANAACDSAPEESLEVQFIALIDQLTGWHLRLLHYLRDPKALLKADSPVRTNPQRDIMAGIAEVVPEIAAQPDLIAHLYEDLFSRRLVFPRSVKVRPGLPALAKRSTDLGDRFLGFVTSPTSDGDPVPAPQPPVAGRDADG